ncbi:MAG: type II secretion system protein [Lachnospiraceae bacterium]|nr:type II secretion system protein [Lachnospiraceae bacterium]
MGNKTDSKKNRICDNNGFSIVEVLVAVAILAVVFAPILKTFSTAASVNGRAQKVQNVTSLAEGVMEDVKGKSIQELLELGNIRTDVTFEAFDKDGNHTESDITKGKKYTVFYEDITATQGITYDAKVTIDTDKYSTDKSSMSEGDEGYSDISDANIRELPQINKVDSHNHAVISWEINQYDDKALENLAAENSTSGGGVSALKTSYAYSAEKDINITIKEDSGLTKISCEIEYKPGNSTDKSLKYLVYNGYFEDQATAPLGGPNVYLFYTLSEKVAPAGESFKKEHININDTTSGKRHSVYLIMQDGVNKLSTLNGSKVTLNVSGSGWSDSVSYNSTSTISDSTKLLSTTPNGDVIFGSNLLDENNKIGELYDSSSKTRIYYVTVDIMEHGKTEVIETLTSTMQAGKETN